MKTDVINTPVERPEGKIRLIGSVAGVEACELLADRDEIVVGSGLDCDLVTADPLMAARAFKLLRNKCHCGPLDPCRCVWTLSPYPRSRVFVNDQAVAGAERMIFGDTIATGCHRFTFQQAAPGPRNRRSNQNVGDLCARLLREVKTPPGFLNSSPLRLYWRRRRKALGAAGMLAALLLLVLTLTPRPERFVPIQLPLDVVMLTESLPAADAVRSLGKVSRQVFEPPKDAGKPQLNPNREVKVDELAVKPVVRTDQILTAPAPRALEQAALDTKALAPDAIASDLPQQPAEVPRRMAQLGTTAPTRRLSVAEAIQSGAAPGLGRYEVTVDDRLLRSASFLMANNNGRAEVREPSQQALATDRAKTLGALAAFKPSPLQFEDVDGIRTPLARVAEQLKELEVRAAGQGVSMDGVVSVGEAAGTWKSGNFMRHGPGTPPPPASPEAYCYVGKSELAGQPALYVSFVCRDPNLDQLVIRNGSIPESDSVEVYLDTNYDRFDYYQLLVNAQGQWASHLHKGGVRHEEKYDLKASVKTVINKEAGQWTCEILIPFDRLGGMPKPGTRWGVNFCRNFRGQRQGKSQTQTWFNVYRGDLNFHNAPLFGIFQW